MLNKNIELKKRIALTVIRSKNCTWEQYWKAINILNSFDPELAREEMKFHHLYNSIEYSVKKVG